MESLNHSETPMSRCRLSITAICLALLALSCGGREPAPQPAADFTAAAEPAAAPEKQPQVLEENYPGYLFRHLYLEYQYEIDLTAPVIYSRLDTVINNNHEQVLFYHNDWRESRSTLDSLPETIRNFMRENGIVVPGFNTGPMFSSYEKLFLKGRFDDDGIQDWVVVCARDGYCWITIFWDGETSDTSIVNFKPMDESVDGRGAGRTIFKLYNDDRYSDTFEVFNFFELLDISYEYYLWPQSPARPDSFTHYGFAEFNPLILKSIYNYLNKGKLLSWGPVPGWEEWHEMNMVTIQDSLLHSPLDCHDLPETLAESWERIGRQIAYIPGNPCCVKGDFFQPGCDDLMVLTSDLDEHDPDYKVKLRTVITAEPDSSYELLHISVKQFKYLHYRKVSSEFVEKCIQHENLIDRNPEYDEPPVLPELPLDLSGFHIGYLNPYRDDYMAFFYILYQVDGELRLIPLRYSPDFLDIEY